jgi:hypothetical protein
LDESQPLVLIPKLHKLITTPPQAYHTKWSSLFHFPVGQFRLALIECVNLLFQSNFGAVHKRLMKERILTTLFDLFFQNKRNNILHCAIQKIFFNVLYCDDSSLPTSFIIEYNLLDKLMSEFEDFIQRNQKAENVDIKPPQNTRYEKVVIEERQYLGHLFLIADKIRRVAALVPDLYKMIEDNMRWKELTDGIWSEMQELQKRKFF